MTKAIKRFEQLLASAITCVMVSVLNSIAQPVYSPSDYRFQHYDMSDGLASENAQEIVQDSLGYLWILHANGLSRYDGYTFKFYKHDPSDELGPGPPLDGHLELDRSGNLWLISFQALNPDRQVIITKYDRKKDSFIKYYPDMKGAIGQRPYFDKDNTTVWIGSRGRGLYRFDMQTGETKVYLNMAGDSVIDLTRDTPMEQRNAIFAMSDRDSILLLATWKGLWQFDKATKKFSHPKCHPADSSMLYNEPIHSILEWPEYNTDLCFVIYNRGLIKSNRDLSEKATTLFVGLSGTRDRSFLRDKYGVFWLTDINKGLFRYDPKDGSLVNLKLDPSDPYSLRSNRLTGFTIDRDQNLWVATQDRGISKLAKQSLRFYNYDFKADVTGNTLYKANARNLLIVSQSKLSQEGDNDIMLSTVNTSNVGKLEFKKVHMNYPLKGRVTQLASGTKRLWIGTGGLYGEGVVGLPINHTSGLIESGPALVFGHDPKNKNTIGGSIFNVSNVSISGLWEDSEQNLWIGSGTMEGGLNKVSLNKEYGKEGSVVRYNHITADSNSLSNGVIWWEMYPEDKNSFWVITASGLDLFRNGKFEHYFKNDYVLTVKRDSKGALLVGTTNGLYEGIDGQRFTFRKNPSKILSNTGVAAFQEDKLGRLWISTHRAIQCYDRQRNVVVQFAKTEGIDFARDWVEQTSDGVLMTADAQGVTLFDPTSFKIDETSVLPVITRLTVNNETPLIEGSQNDSDGFYIKEDISVLEELIIDYQHNNFTIEFSAMEMTAPEKNLYRHELEGYDKDWIETDFNGRTATYTNLDAGEYTFKVKASNHHGIWSDVEKTLKIKVLPPPWKSTWAYIGYGIIFLGLLYAARKSIVQRERLKSNLKLEKVEREKEHFELEKAKEVDKVKSTFFANISHEFRTPLTLIKGPVQELLEEHTNHPKTKERLKLVERNADLVLKLINQLLDLAKLESGTLTVETSETDLNTFLSVVTNSFSSLAFQKNITMETESPQQRTVVNLDKGKVETILINLINNAIKFTPVGGSVAVRTELRILQVNNESQSAGTPLRRRGVGGEVIITVSDTGIGIDNDQHEKVFERFHQVSEAHKEVGTGIGLSLVKELVGLMKGTLSLKSEPGKGSEFTIKLPVEVIRVITEAEGKDNVTDPHLSEEFPLKENGHVSQEIRPRILVVEDNSDLRKFIIGSLGDEFHFLEGADGKQGLEIAFEETPDLIISDVMMPEMDGITMTAKIKSDTRTSHIPLILLTAKTSDESKLSGLGTGADDYLTKPFNKNELLLKVRNSIALRVKLREKIKLEVLKESPNIEVQSADEKFLLKVREVILGRLGDEQLSVEALAEEIGLSRSQLFRKISALTGVSVNELIRAFRLQKAAQLLEQNWAPVTQIAYEVGFSNLSYFSKAFKEKYGVSPSEYPVKTA